MSGTTRAITTMTVPAATDIQVNSGSPNGILPPRCGMRTTMARKIDAPVIIARAMICDVRKSRSIMISPSSVFISKASPGVRSRAHRTRPARSPIIIIRYQPLSIVTSRAR
ncbi:hypothetical protein AYO44_09755 [Planctomycetaceae bacterium SCGC AG-212-F19]|nr:hypothetical protein AYO44_09755 [Planctomycetaceae bacterium SCGC AG-212-F19]